MYFPITYLLSFAELSSINYDITKIYTSTKTFLSFFFVQVHAVAAGAISSSTSH
jgi:hypothetical protein